MRSFTFLLMELLARTDRALRLEQGKARPDRLAVIWLGRQRRRQAARLRRSLGAQFAAAGA